MTQYCIKRCQYFYTTTIFCFTLVFFFISSDLFVKQNMFQSSVVTNNRSIFFKYMYGLEKPTPNQSIMKCEFHLNREEFDRLTITFRTLTDQKRLFKK